MKGRPATLEQKHFHGVLADNIGCIACAKDGMFTSYVSIHHIDGRTKPRAHWLVLPVCGPHHQDVGIPGVEAIHKNKARFEKKYGTQRDLLRECIQILLDRGCVVPDGALRAAGVERVAA
jgi:hypothetical protein